MSQQQLLQQGIAAAIAGEREQAYHDLTQVVEADEQQLTAWLWLSQLADRFEDRVTCLENVLALEPDHAIAKPLLAWLQAQQVAPEIEPEDLLPIFPEPADSPVVEVVALPPVITPKSPTILPYIEASKGGAILVDEFDDEFLCVYCAAPTAETDKACPVCHQQLLEIKPTTTERSQWLWRGCWLQLAVTFYLLTAGLIYFGFMARWGEVKGDLGQLLPLYIGLSVDQPAEQVALMLKAVPLWQFWGYILGLIYSTLITLMLFFRWPHGNIIYFLHTGLLLIMTLLVAVLVAESRLMLAGCMLAFVVGVGQLLVAMNIANDFGTETKRLKLKIDSGVKGHTSLYVSGRDYSRQGKWGLAVIHLRRAVAHQASNLTYLLALVKAYLALKRPALAADILNMAEQLEPTSAEVQALKQQLKVRSEK